MLVVLVSGCLRPVDEPGPSYLVAGPTGGGGVTEHAVPWGDAGSADGGAPWRDGGLVAPLGPLDPALDPTLPGPCGRVFPQAPRCASGGSCLVLELPSGTRTEIATPLQVSPATLWHYPVGPMRGGFAFVTTDGSSTLWLAGAGGPPRALETTPPSVELHVKGFDEDDVGAWYIAERRAWTPQPMLHSRELMVKLSGFPLSRAAANLAPPTSNGVAVGTRYYVGLEDGLHRFATPGEGMLVHATGADEFIAAVAADTAGAVFLQCRVAQRHRCTLWRTERAAGEVASPVGALELAQTNLHQKGSVALLGGHAYVLGAEGLLRVPRGGGAFEQVYAGAPWAGWGTLQADSLRALGGRLYFGGVCQFDSDAPTYGSIELDPGALTARWLESDPAFPFVPWLTQPFAGEPGPYWVSNGQLFEKQ